ncbi:hypothetical protein [Nocardioides lijunqiniae]|uniref:hypothetical protein n=1 Tax=Nocardioides lijunqiniae TaxID=2760832 RepID=UPI001878AFE8|nr:hypothetical protein [Nocardioides lijunqiniae]
MPASTVALEILTDEELSVLTPGPGAVVTPFLSAVPDAERDAVRRTALRGLVARGIVDPPAVDATATPTPGSDGTEVEVDAMVRQDVLSALTLRQAARRVVAVARTTATGQDFWYAHLVDEIALLEEVGSDGLHRFALGHTAALAELLAGATLHPDAADGTGEPVVLTGSPDGEAPPELLEHLGAAYVRADVLVIDADRDERPAMTGLFTGPRGSWSVVADPATGRVSARPETVASLRGRVEALAAEATASTDPATEVAP